MFLALNQDIAGRLDEVGRLLADQGADRFRVQAYRRAADSLRAMTRSAAEIFEREGLAGLERIPAVGPSIARAIRDLLLHGRLAMLERLRGAHDAIALFRSVPGIGSRLATTLHDELGLNTLADLEAAAHDGRLETLAGLGAKRIAGIRDSLAYRLARVRAPASTVSQEELPAVDELLSVDAEYRREASAGRLKTIAPQRFNPTHAAWLPILHTQRSGRHYTALFSNSAQAHARHRTLDWVVLYFDGDDGEGQATVITAEFGPLKGLRSVRGREAECLAHYHKAKRSPPRVEEILTRQLSLGLANEAGGTP
jgi:hypothetical protein